MNLFQRYGIKEVADVTFYSIINIGDEELLIPVLFLDTLKVSDLNQTVDKAVQKGGYANQKILSWQFNKSLTLQIDDALFSNASMNTTMGWLSNKPSKIISLIRKISIVNKYIKNNYSTLAIQSPKLTKDEQDLLFNTVTNLAKDSEEIANYFGFQFAIDPQTQEKIIAEINKIYITPYASENLYNLLNIYYKRDKEFPRYIIDALFEKIQKATDYNKMSTSTYNIQTLDRFERCYVDKEDGLEINLVQQKKNLQKYFDNNREENYEIFYDIKNMCPLGITEMNKYKDNLEGKDAFKFILKKGTSYYKWSRTIQPVYNDVSFIGQSLVIDENTFPGEYRIVGETYIREQDTTKDQKYQFVIPHASIPSNQKIELKADGGPSVFSMQVEVLNKEGYPPIELRQFNVDKDLINGGTVVTPQYDDVTYTQIIPKVAQINEIENNIIY